MTALMNNQFDKHQLYGVYVFLSRLSQSSLPCIKIVNFISVLIIFSSNLRKDHEYRSIEFGVFSRFKSFQLLLCLILLSSGKEITLWCNLTRHSAVSSTFLRILWPKDFSFLHINRFRANDHRRDFFENQLVITFPDVDHWFSTPHLLRSCSWAS